MEGLQGPHLLQGTISEKRLHGVQSTNKTEQPFWTLQKYFL